MKFAAVNPPTCCSSLLALLLSLHLAQPCWGQQDVAQLEQDALFKAAEYAAQFVVKVECIGGAERVGNQLVSSAPTSGIIVDSTGYVVCSAYAFERKPTAILVELPDGSRNAAEVIARDQRYGLVLLKVPTSSALPLPSPADANNIQVGQWAITVARTLPGEGFNMSVGIVSAKNRIWGKAIQIDANVSPANYGGALVGIDGRIAGILVPRSPQSDEVMAGTEWYDSGIGFAIPLDSVLAQLDRWKEGDLYSGKIGIAMKSENLYGPPIVGVCRPKSPGRDADIRKGDTIVSANGTPVTNYAQLKHVLGPLLAGDDLELGIVREGKKLAKRLTLTDKLEPYEHAFLGILPNVATAAEKAGQRVEGPEADIAEKRPQTSEEETTLVDEAKDASPDGTQESDDDVAGIPQGVLVRWVYPDSPASSIIEAGDTIVSVDTAPVVDEISLRLALAEREPKQQLRLEVLRKGQRRELSVTLASDTEQIPDSVPERANVESTAEELPPLGKITVKLPEEVNDCDAYIPETYDPQLAHALLVLLPSPGEKDIAGLIRPWRELCAKTGSILLVPQSRDELRWEQSESQFIRKTVENLRKDYSIDTDRIAIFGSGSSGAMAFLTGFTYRDLFRGVAVADARIPRSSPALYNEPLQRLSFWAAKPKEGRMRSAMEANAKLLRKLKFPVSELEWNSSEIEAEQRASVLHWLDGLDRI